MITIETPPVIASLELRLPLLRSASPIARSALQQFTRRAGLSGTRRHDFLLAVTEAVNNAIEHTKERAATGMFHLLGEITERDIVIDVCDDGYTEQARWASGRGAGAAFADRGRGILLMRELCPKVEFNSTPDGTCVRFTFPRFAEGL
jgi:anti-sigma regulatory factor (Ser/Thr protein kinase)